VTLIAATGFAIDQAFKLWMLHGFDLPARGRVEIAPFLDLVMVWNQGISYGLFQQGDAFGQIALAVITAIVTVFLWLWGARATAALPAIALGLIIGGALGNGVDRFAYGAVADFFHFHVGTFSWYVFNFADVWIVAGALGLLYDGFTGDGRKEAALPAQDTADSGGSTETVSRTAEAAPDTAPADSPAGPRIEK